MEKKFMYRAIELAKKGIGFVNPNPLVGAVIVKEGKIIGEGYHEKYGTLHAERNALKNCNEITVGADIYVTLEPCCHYGKQPPCTEAIINAGIKNVYVGSFDPNPLVAGKGLDYLRKHGINVYENVLKNECDEINSIFFHYITKKRPYVILKSAMTIDGKCATANGDSKWISNEKSRANVHFTRKQCAAIMVGINTVIRDNPMLNCRLNNPSNPVRVVCDSHLRIPLSSNLIKTAKDIPLIIATVSKNNDKIQFLKNLGVHIIVTPGEQVDLTILMDELGQLNIDSVLLEGGGELNASMLKEDLVDKIQIYIAPKIIGGQNSKSIIAGNGVDYVKDAYLFKNPVVKFFENDVMIEYIKKEDA